MIPWSGRECCQSLGECGFYISAIHSLLIGALPRSEWLPERAEFGDSCCHASCRARLEGSFWAARILQGTLRKVLIPLNMYLSLEVQCIRVSSDIIR